MLQLLLLILMVFTVMSASVVFISIILTKATGFSLSQVSGIGPNSPAALVLAMSLVQGASNLFTFCVPALLFAYLATPYPASYLGFRRPGKPVQLLLALLIMIGATPLLSGLEGLVGLINFGPGAKAAQKANDDMLSAFLNVGTFPAFLRVFSIFAVIPALGEELFFRGLLLRFAKKRSRNMVFPTIFTAAVFAGVHANINGLVSIFCAGILLAVIYNLTGSIWCSMLGHLSFNGLQIFLSYLGNGNATIKAFMANNTVPYYMLACGVVLFGISFYLLWKNRTPLPPNWADDYTPEEISAKAY